MLSIVHKPDRRSVNAPFIFILFYFIFSFHLIFHKDHFNYVAATSAQGPIIVSVAVDPMGCIRIFIQTTTVTCTTVFPYFLPER